MPSYPNLSTPRRLLLCLFSTFLFLVCLTSTDFVRSKGYDGSTSVGTLVAGDGRRTNVALPDISGKESEKTVSEAKLLDDFGKTPLNFEINAGQTDSQIKFLTRGTNYNLLLTSNEAILKLSAPSRETKVKKNKPKNSILNGNELPDTVKVSFKDSDPEARVTGLGELPGTTNYLIGNNPERWQTGIKNYGKVKYEQIYPGIDLLFYGNRSSLEYDFIVSPQADPSIIRINFDGAKKIKIDRSGDLLIKTKNGVIRQHKARLYQEKDGRRMEIEGGYVRLGRSQIGFKVGSYDRSRPLVIDPVLVYSTYAGGGMGSSRGLGIAVDGSGAAYVVGSTSAIDFLTVNPIQSSYGGSGYSTGVRGEIYGDAFALKLDPTGSSVLYSTYIGGSGTDGATDVAVDSGGNAFVTGVTCSANFPVLNAYQPQFRGPSYESYCSGDAFLLKLNPSGSAFGFSTYLGGNSEDLGYGVALDNFGNPFVTGSTSSTDFPVFNGFQSGSYGYDAFITQFNAQGSELRYSTYLGGTGEDFGQDITVDASGHAYVTGFTRSTDFPTLNAYQNSYRGGYSDAFVAKISPTGSELVYSTYLGGTALDQGHAIAINEAGEAYVTGETWSSGFPTTMGAYDRTYGGGNAPDAFVTKFNSAGRGLVYSTFLGGNSSDAGYSLRLDGTGNAYVLGETSSSNFPTTSGSIAPPPSGTGTFLTKVQNTGAGILFSTLLGASYVYGSAIDATGAIYVTGSAYCYSAPTLFSFRTTPGAAQTQCSADFMTPFVSKIVGEGSYKISGRIIDQDGNPIQGTKVEVTGSLLRTTVTDSNGDYWIGGLSPGGNFTVAPTSSLYTFSPSQQSHPSLSVDKVSDFTGTLKSYLISGHIRDQVGGPISDVTISLTGSQTDTRQSAADGSYSFTVPAGGTYYLFPSKPGHVFGPEQREFIGLDSNQSADFSEAVSISGHIADANNNDLDGVTIALTGTFNKTTTSDSGGNYIFGNLIAAGNYAVTPSKEDYSFTPNNRTFTSVNSNNTADFIGTTPDKYVVSGKLSYWGTQVGVPNVTVTMAGNGKNFSASTNSSGNYSFPATEAGFSYVVQPTGLGFIFSPMSQTIANLDSNKTLDFSVSNLTISGSICFPSSMGSYPVVVRLTGTDSATFITNQFQPNGCAPYSFKVRQGGNYTVTLEDEFNNPSQTFTNVSSSITRSFSMPEHVVFGSIFKADGTPLYGHYVLLDIHYNGSTISRSAYVGDGNFWFYARAGADVTVTPAPSSGIVFSPYSQSISNIQSNRLISFQFEFIGQALIGGRVVNHNNVGLGGTEVRIWGATNEVLQTQPNGDFQSSSLAGGLDYWVAPSKKNYLFTPLYRSYPNLDWQNATPANFSAVKTGKVFRLPVLDAYVSSPLPLANFGTSSELHVSRSTATNSEEESYLTFDLNGIEGSLASAKLRVHGRSMTGTTLSLNAYSTSPTWFERGSNGITWATKPSKSAQPISSATVSGSADPAWHEIDLTEYFNSEIDTGRRVVSIALVAPNDSTSGSFDSRDANEFKPELEITTTPVISSVSPSTGNVGQTVTLSGINFGSLQGESLIAFNGVSATPTSWTDTSVVTTVPSGAVSGPLSITVNGVTSNAVMFNVSNMGTVAGTVRRASDNATVSGATVQALQNGVIKGTASTNGSGAYTIANLPAGVYDIRASATGYSSATISGNNVAAGTTTTVNILLASAGAIAGKITKSDGTTAISGATVTVFSNGSAVGTATSNATGDYTVGGLTGGTFTVEVSAAGYQTKSQTGVTVSNGATTTVNLSLAGTIGTFHLHKEASSTSGLFQLTTSGPDGTSLAIQTVDLKNQSVGEKLIKAFDTQSGVPNTAGAILSGSTVSFTLWMKKTANVGTMYPRAKVFLNNSGGTNLCTTTGTSAIGTTLTKYTLSCTTSADIPTTASDRFYLWVGVNLTAGSTTTTFNAELDVEGTLNGNYNSLVSIPLGLTAPTIANLSPNSGAVETLVAINGNNFGATQGTGSVRFNGLTSVPTAWSNTRIDVRVPVGATTGPVTVSANGSTSNGVAFTVLNSGAISGTITRIDNGNPIGGAAIDVFQYNQLKASTTSAANGSYQIGGMASGAYTVRVSATGLGTALRENVFVAENGTATVNLALGSGGTVLGRVTKTDGTTAIPAATIRLYRNETLIANTTTNASGDYSISNIGAGSYTVEVSNPGFQTTSRNVAVSSGATTTANFSLNSTALTYRLHKEASTTPGALQLKVSNPDAAASLYLSAELNGQGTGEKTVMTFDSLAGDPGAGGVITSGSTVSFSIWYRKTANIGTMKPKAKLYLNGTSGQLLCASTSSNSLTTTLTKYNFNCTLANGVSMSASDRFFIWAGIDLTVTASSSVKAEIDVEGVANGNYDSTVTVPTPIAIPVISGLSPASGVTGTPVTIAGSGFGSSQGTSVVSFNGVPAQLYSWNDATILTTVPEGALTGPVVVQVQNQNSNGVQFTVVKQPRITSAVPAYGSVGTSVVLDGINFGATQGGSVVRFNGSVAQPTSWGTTRITVPVPAGTLSGPLMISVGGMDSNAIYFTLTNSGQAGDTDNDGIPDAWEMQYFGNLNQTASGDFDGDGVSNLMEYLQGRNPTKGTVQNGLIDLKIFTPLHPLWMP